MAVLEAYAQILAPPSHGAIAAGLHRGEHVTPAQQHLHEFVRDLLTDAAGAGGPRRRHRR